MDPKKTPLKKSKMARRHGRLRTVDAPPCPPVPVVPKRLYLRAISDFFVGVFLGSMYVLSRSWLATKTRYVVNLGVHSHRPPPGDVAAAPPLSPSRRPRPRHDPPATFACPVGLWRRLRVRSDTGLATRTRRASAAGLVPLLWRNTGSPGGGERAWNRVWSRASSPKIRQLPLVRPLTHLPSATWATCSSISRASPPRTDTTSVVAPTLTALTHHAHAPTTPTYDDASSYK